MGPCEWRHGLQPSVPCSRSSTRRRRTMGASKRDGRLRGGGAESERCAQGATERDRVRVNNREKTGKPLGRLGQCRSLADRGNTSRSRAEVTRSPHTAYVYASVHTYTTHTNTRAAHVQRALRVCACMHRSPRLTPTGVKMRRMPDVRRGTLPQRHTRGQQDSIITSCSHPCVHQSIHS